MPKRAASPTPASSKEHLAVRYYRLGRQLLAPDGVSDKEFRDAATKLSLKATDDTWYKAIRLARLFKADVSQLRSLCRPQPGKSLGWSHIIELMQVERAADRKKFAALVVGENLDAAALRQEIRKSGNRTSKRPGSGRKRREPRNTAEALWRAGAEAERLKTTLEWMLTRSLDQGFDGDVKLAIKALNKLNRRLAGVAGSK